MGLILRIIRFDKGSPPPEMEYQWNEMGGTIGRRSSNDWVLPDTKRFLSGQHAEVKAKGGDYYITDTSTNGVFVNGKAVPIGRDNSLRLEHGDVLKMGAYEIEVELEQGKKASSAGVPAMPFDAFDEPEEEIPSLPVKGASNYLADESNAAQGFEFPEPAADEPPVLPDWDNNGANRENAGSHVPDPFFVDDEFNSGRERQQLSADFGSEVIKDDPFSGLSDFFEPPGVVSGDPSGTDEEVGELHQDVLLQQGGDGSVGDGNPGLPEIPGDFWTSTDDELADPFAQDNFAKPLPARDRKPLEDKWPRSKDVPGGGHAIPSPPKPKGRAVPQDGSVSGPGGTRERQSAPQADTAGISQEKMMADFLKGFGISDPAKQQNIAQNLKMETVGMLFRIMLQGCMEVLRTRTSIKSEMRMDVTTIQPIQNNPVKFSIDVEDALLKLLVPQGQSYMPPEQALAEAFDDIKAHQVAVIAGVQTSLKHVLKRFEPEKLVERLEEQGSVIDKIPIQREAKLWELFEGLYSTIEEEAGDDFHRLFGLEFSRAYEAQIAKLESMRE